MREERWSCGGDLLARISHHLFGTGDERVCERLAEIAEIGAPLTKWHEMGSFDSRAACEEARDEYAGPGSRPENVAECLAAGYPGLNSHPGLTGRGRLWTVR
jgi:hypothetical protein